MADYRTPREALHSAGGAIRSCNHLSSTRFGANRTGWTGVAEAYDCAAELAHSTSMLPQVIAHLMGSIATAATTGQVGVDGGRSAEDVDRVTRAVGAAFARAARAAHVLADETRVAQNELSVVHEVATVSRARHDHRHQRVDVVGVVEIARGSNAHPKEAL